MIPAIYERQLGEARREAANLNRGSFSTDRGNDAFGHPTIGVYANTDRVATIHVTANGYGVMLRRSTNEQATCERLHLDT